MAARWTSLGSAAVPLPSRSVPTARTRGRAENPVAVRERAVTLLCSPELSPIVDLVAYPEGAAVVVANAAGTARLSRDGSRELLSGADPVARQDPFAFDTVEAELRDPTPANAANSYPLAGLRLHSLFQARLAPDIAVVHTGAHYWPERGGHLGEHGSLAVMQSRAPFVLAGAGVEKRGTLPRAARVVDVGPTLAWLAGAPPAALGELDGTALVDLATAGAAEHVVGLLWDGANANSLYELAGAGELPSVGRLLERGFAMSGGAIAEFPSVTLVNHASALTGVGPGRHGIVNNNFLDRAGGGSIAANEAVAWHLATDWLEPGARTVFEYFDPATSACVNEPVDRGAGYSTFGLVRAAGSADGAKGMTSQLPDPHDDAHVSGEFLDDADYAWSTQVDAIGLTQMTDLFAADSNAPQLTWWNTTLTDTGHHNGGPHSAVAHASLRDSDRRLGVFLDLLEATGRLDRTAFLLTADHGSQRCDPECRGDWDEVLAADGIAFRDEAYGFIYLGAD